MIAQLDSLYIRTRFWKLWSRLISYIFYEGRPITTSGRWFNSFVFIFLSLLKRLPISRKVTKPIFIIGIGRSGTTVLGKVMSMNRQVGYLNEPKALWHAIYPHEDIIGNYSQEGAKYRLTTDDASKLTIQNAKRLYGSYLVTSFSSRVVDKYPELIFRVPFVKTLFPNAKFLFLVRNGWDTCSSIDLWSNRLAKSVDCEHHDWWGVNKRKWHFMVEQLVPEQTDLLPHAKEMYDWDNHTDMAVVEWILAMREGLTLIKQYPNDILRVNYEDLCQDPLHGLKEISVFTDLDELDQCFFDYGNKTLKQVTSKKPSKIHPLLVEAFNKTMLDLGYDIIQHEEL